MRTSRQQREKNNDSDCEKLRNDLFEYRVSIRSYIKNLNTIIISGTIVLSVLAFFGYNKIENIQKIVLDKANQRLAQTDSILAQIDQAKIDSLNLILKSKEKQLSETIDNFEKIVSQNQLLEIKLLESLPENTRNEPSINSYIPEYQHGIFNTRPFKQQVKLKENVFVYVVIDENFNLNENCYLSISLRPKNRNILIQYKRYIVNSRLNKISFSIDQAFEKYTEYELEIGLFRKEKSDYKYYYNKFPITIK